MISEQLSSEAFINIEQVKTDSFERFRSCVADAIENDNLAWVNAHSSAVVPRITLYSKFFKRFFDIVLSVIALLITLPINVLLAICTFVDVGKPIFFRQERVGRGGKLFTITKFRNMTNETDANGELLPASKRVTRFGRFVRKTSLDELLNFWSILKGDMSIIGPRPLAPRAYQRYSERHKGRTEVRPGLECPSIHAVDHKVSWAEQFENDVYYVEHLSFLLDLKMVWLLVKMVFNQKGNTMRGSAVRGSFVGYNRDGSSINSRSVPRKYVEMALREMDRKK